MNQRFCSGLSTRDTCWKVRLEECFLEQDLDLAHNRSDALYIDPRRSQSWLNLELEDVLKLRKTVYGLINAPLRWHQRLSRALRQAGFVSLQLDPCVLILPVPSPEKGVSLVDVPTKLRIAVADSSVSPATEIRMDRWIRQRNVQRSVGSTCW